MAFAGLGALTAAAFVRAGVPFMLSIVLGALGTAALAGVVGVAPSG